LYRIFCIIQNIRRTTSIATAAALILAVVVFVAGCGGGEDTPTLTKAEYTKSAKALCEKAQRKRQTEVEALAKKLGKLDNQAKSRLVTAVILPSLHRQLENLEEIGLPEGEEQKTEAFLGNLEAEIEKIEAQPVKSIEGGALEGTREKATALGLGTCV
jgi:hypothetical protein